MLQHSFKIYTEKWHRGAEAAAKDAFLYNGLTHKFDIMGFLLKEIGVHTILLDRRRLPSAVAHKYLPNKRQFPAPFEWIVSCSHADTQDTFDLITLNDDPYMKDEEREERIVQFLKQRGIGVKFTSAEREAAEKKTSVKPSFVIQDFGSLCYDDPIEREEFTELYEP